MSEKETKAEKGEAPECPSGFSRESKAAWPDLPECVREDVARRISEIESGFLKYRDRAAAFEEIAEYAERAEQSGTTLAQALENYTTIEDLLRRDFVAGIRALCVNADMATDLLVYQLAGGPVVPLGKYEEAVAELNRVAVERDTYITQVGEAARQIEYLQRSQEFRKNGSGYR